MVVGRQLSGKSTLCQYMGEQFGFKVVDMKEMMERAKKLAAGEEGADEDVEVPAAQIEKEVL